VLSLTEPSVPTLSGRPAVASPSTSREEFGRIFREHAPFAWRTLRRLGVDARETDDACQDVFVVVQRKLGQFEGRSSLKTWIYGVCLKVASDYRRRASSRRETLHASFPDRAAEGGPHAALERKEALRLLDALLDGLDEDKRAVFVLYEIEQLSMREVAEIVACPAQTAYARLYAARRQVQQSAEAMAGGGQ
jgi:RNA polymerase sigma-70 factor (ECF subfamily)